MQDSEEFALRRAVIETARELNRRGINVNKSGNISARFREGFLITPTGIPYEALIPEDIVFIDLKSGGCRGNRLPSSEWEMHAEVYRIRSDAGAVAHCHSAYATALGTQSSAATIPVTLAQAVKNGVRENIAIFTVPLCATIHLAGSTMKIVACAMAIMIMAGEPVTFSNFSGFIMMLGITMVAAPGVPGGAIMAALGILQSMLGFNETLQALMIALYIAMDSFGTACNVTGDGAIAVVVDKIAGKNTP